MQKIHTLVLQEEHNHVIGDKRKGEVQRADTCQNHIWHIPLVSLLLWCEMVAMCCLLHLASSLTTVVRQTEGRQAGRQANENTDLKNSIPSHLCFIIFNAGFEVRYSWFAHST